MAWSWPKITSLRLRSRFFSTSRSEAETLLAGMRAMRATTSSMCAHLDRAARARRPACRRRRAPASSTTSMALSGRWRSLMWRVGQLGGRAQRLVGVARRRGAPRSLRLQAHQDLDGLGHRGLDHVDLLEAPRERVILLEDAAVFLVGGRADAADLAVGEHRLDEVGGIHDAAGGGAGADHGVDLVDEQDRAGLLLQLRDHRLQALLEVAAVLGAGDQRAHVERVDGAVGQHLGHLALDDQARQPFGDRGLADAGLADVQRIVLAAAAQDLDGALDLELAADQRIDAPFLRHAR